MILSYLRLEILNVSRKIERAENQQQNYTFKRVDDNAINSNENLIILSTALKNLGVQKLDK